MATRNYVSEYKRYQKQQKQKKDRASRNAARRLMLKKGKVKRGDGKDVSHKNGNPRDNRPKNLTVERQSKNRSYRRTRTAGKLHRTAQKEKQDMPMHGKKKSKMMNRGGAAKKKTKYMAKGGMKKTKYMAKGGMKKTKYMARGGAAKRK